MTNENHYCIYYSSTTLLNIYLAQEEVNWKHQVEKFLSTPYSLILVKLLRTFHNIRSNIVKSSRALLCEEAGGKLYCTVMCNNMYCTYHLCTIYSVLLYPVLHHIESHNPSSNTFIITFYDSKYNVIDLEIRPDKTRMIYLIEGGIVQSGRQNWKIITGNFTLKNLYHLIVKSIHSKNLWWKHW